MGIVKKFRGTFDVKPAQGDTTGHKKHAFADPTRNMLVVIFGEFCGTFMFLLMAFIGVQTAQKTNHPANIAGPLLSFSLLYIAASFGASLAVNVWIFYRVTGGMFNPAVTLALMLVGAVRPLRALYVFPTQIVAGICAAAVADALLPGPLTVGDALSAGTNVAQGLFIEMFLTAQLVLTVYFLAVEKHRSTYLAPVGLGVSIFICHICGTNYTGTGINPARSFGPAVIQGFPSYHWIYWLGPFLGTLLAFGVYTVLKGLEYQTANPGQDSDDVEKANRDTLLPSDAAIREAEGKPPMEATRNDSVMEGQSNGYNDSNYGGNNQQTGTTGGHVRGQHSSSSTNSHKA